MPQTGSILVIILAMFALFMTMMLTGSRLISLQYHEAVNQEEREQAFHIAEAGIRYSLWLLNVANVPPQNLQANPPPPQEIRDQATNEVLGTFALSFIVTKNGNETTVNVTSVGTDYQQTTIQQTIVAIMKSTDNTSYFVESWRHLL